MKRLLPGLTVTMLTAAMSLLAPQARANTDSLLHVVEASIEKAPVYDATKLQRIARLQVMLHSDTTKPSRELFGVYEKLFEEYQIFHYDSAYEYAGRLQQIAWRLGDRELITKARLRLSFILLSSGLFRETYDTLRSIDIRKEPDSLRATYYALMGRYYYDLANYD